MAVTLSMPQKALQLVQVAGATVVGIAVAVGATVTAPVVIGVVAAGALIGAAYEYFSD